MTENNPMAASNNDMTAASNKDMKASSNNDINAASNNGTTADDTNNTTADSNYMTTDNNMTEGSRPISLTCGRHIISSPPTQNLLHMFRVLIICLVVSIVQ